MMLQAVVITEADRVYLVEQIADACEACEVMGEALCRLRTSIEQEQAERLALGRIDLDRARKGSPFRPPWES